MDQHVTKLTIDIGVLSRDVSEFTVDQFIAALEATTTLTHLVVEFDYDYPDDPRIVAQLARCISNLKRRNENHPLRTIELTYTDEVELFEELLMAAKQFGIRHLKIDSMPFLSVHVIVNFLS